MYSKDIKIKEVTAVMFKSDTYIEFSLAFNDYDRLVFFFIVYSLRKEFDVARDARPRCHNRINA